MQYDLILRNVDNELKRIEKELKQHRFVLDYITACQGKICSVAGTVYRNYISDNPKQGDALLQNLQ